MPYGPDTALCYRGCDPRMLAGILRDGLLPSYGKQNICGVWSSPHIHTAVRYPQALTRAVAVTDIQGPAVRVVLTLEVPRSSIIKRIPGKKNAAGLPVNYQWPLKNEGLCIRAVHLWCYDGHPAPVAAMETRDRG